MNLGPLNFGRRLFRREPEKSKGKPRHAMSDMQRIDHLYELAKAEGADRVVLDDDLVEALFYQLPYHPNPRLWNISANEVQVGTWRGDMELWWKRDAIHS